MTDLITEARELCEKANDIRHMLKNRRNTQTWKMSSNEALELEFAIDLIPELCDALENTEKQLQEQFDKTGAWLEEYNDMKIALEKGQEQNKRLMLEVCRLACESVEREKKLAKLEAEVEQVAEKGEAE